METIAFTGYSATVSQIETPITATRSSRRRPVSYSASVRPGGRELDVKISAELYAQIEPDRPPGRNCLQLGVETGRGGIRRTALPALFDAPIGSERRFPCPERGTADPLLPPVS